MSDGGMNQPGPLYPETTIRSKYQYFFYDKHHQIGPSNDAQWLREPQLTQNDEFQVFNDADSYQISDRKGNLFCLRRKVDECFPPLGTRGEQVAQFPVTRPPQAWHGYPLWPILSRRGNVTLRPIPSDALDKMVGADLINEHEKSRLRKGDHI